VYSCHEGKVVKPPTPIETHNSANVKTPDSKSAASKAAGSEPAGSQFAGSQSRGSDSSGPDPSRPSINVPGANVPGAKVPDANVPSTDAPGIDSPGADLAPANLPAAEVPALRLRDAYKFFIPLMLMAELMMFSHAVIASFLARMDNPEPILAAYSISFYFHATLGSPVWACQIVFLSFIKDKASVRRLAVFGFQTVLAVAWIWLLVALTPLGDWVFGDVFNLSPEVATTAKTCLLIGLCIPPVTVFRSLAYGLLMVEKRTVWVTAGTVLRLAGLAAILTLLTGWFEGAQVGIAALVGCIAIETVFAVAIAWPFYRRLAERTQMPPRYRELWRFSWPIMLMQFAESGVALVVNFFLGRLPRPELALAAFGVLDSLIRVLLSPLRNLIHTTQALVKRRSDVGVILMFSGHCAIFFGLLMLAFNIPAFRDLVLNDIMGLPANIAEYITPALKLSVFLAFAMAAGGVIRGLLIASRNTGAIAASSALRIATVGAVGFIGGAMNSDDGAMLGLVALVCAFGAEAILLGWRLKKIDSKSPGLFGKNGA
jgi:Na+-driven multidrug efflux pump